MELVIVRPPLIYGPGNPGNILKLIRAIHTRTPLPIGQVKNARSFMYVGNLVSALIACTLEPAAAGKTYLVSDGIDLSTPQLVRILAHSMGVVPRIWPVPLSLLKMMGKITGRSASVTKLVSSLKIDSSKIQSDLGWRSPFTPLEGLRATADWFQKKEQTK
jgi:nucleoside-diphosphate-sugar epimerase